MVAHPDVLQFEHDSELVRAFQQGDPDALIALVEEHYPRLLARAKRKTCSLQDAEDAVQETFLRAYRALPQFGGDFHLAAWLGRILANVCADLGNRRLADRQLEERLAGRRDDSEEPVEHLVASTVDRLGLRRVLEEALTSLPTTYRDAFFLREIDDRSYAEVAKVMEISEVNARARVSRARSVLRRSLRGAATGLAVFGAPLRALRYLPVLARHGRPNAPRIPLALPAATQSASGVASLGGSQLPNLILQAAGSPAGQALVNAAPAVGQAVAPTAGVLATTLAVASASLVAPFVTAGPGPQVTSPAPSVNAQAVVAPTSAQVQKVQTATTAPNAPSQSAPAAGAASSSQNGAAQTTQSQPGKQWTWMGAAAGQGGQGGASTSSQPGASGSGQQAAGSSSSPSAPTDNGSAAAVPTSGTSCPWLESFPDATPGSVVMPPPVLDSSSATLFFSSSTVPLNTTGTNFFVATQGSASTNGVTSMMSASFGACLPGTSAPALVVNLSEPGGTEWQLRGALVTAGTTDGTTDVLYRGVGIPVGDLGNVPDPVAFVARVEVEEPANISSLQVAIYGQTPGLVPNASPAPGSGSTAVSSNAVRNPQPSPSSTFTG